jgi:peroxiredoxin
MIATPLHIGDSVPGFELADQSGTAVAVPLAKATILLFYRGFW